MAMHFPEKMREIMQSIEAGQSAESDQPGTQSSTQSVDPYRNLITHELQEAPDFTGDGFKEFYHSVITATGSGVSVQRYLVDSVDNCQTPPCGILVGDLGIPEILNATPGAGLPNYAHADMNNDGRVDIVGIEIDAVDPTSGEIVILSFNGGTLQAGNFDDPIETGINLNSAKPNFTNFKIYVADFNLDTKPDILVVENVVIENESTPDQVDVNLNLYLKGGSASNPTFGAPINLGSYDITGWTNNGIPYSYISVGDISDITGDGFPDILLRQNTLNQTQLTPSFLKNNGNVTPGFTAVDFTSLGIANNAGGGTNNKALPERAYHLFMDINGDGLRDYVFVPETNGGGW